MKIFPEDVKNTAGKKQQREKEINRKIADKGGNPHEKAGSRSAGCDDVHGIDRGISGYLIRTKTLGCYVVAE